MVPDTWPPRIQRILHDSHLSRISCGKQYEAVGLVSARLTANATLEGLGLHTAQSRCMLSAGTYKSC